MEQVTVEQLLPLMEETFAFGGVFRLYPHGNSMLPLLRPGVDSVELASLRKKDRSTCKKSDSEENSEENSAKSYQSKGLVRGDIVLYRRESDNAFVLHRVYRTKQKSFVAIGDNCFAFEKNMPYSRVLARVEGIYRENYFVALTDANYQAYVRRIIRQARWRVLKSKIKNKMRQLFKKETHKN